MGQTRNVYSAFLILLGTQQLRFEPMLRPLKLQWNVSIPKYDTFYRLDFLLRVLLDRPPPLSEEAVREHLILLLRLLCMFRGIDLARCKNQLEFKGGSWFLSMMRKGQKSWALYPIPDITPKQVNPRYWLLAYIGMVKRRGSFLLWSLPGKGPSKPSTANTINAITTRFLKSQGLEDYTAHSTRGAAATSLLLKGVPPGVVQQLGGWKSESAFQKFYNRVQCSQNWAQSLVPC